MGFLNFSKIKYLGGDSVSGKVVYFFGNLIQNRFFKRFARFGLFGDYLFHIALVRSDSKLWESDTVGHIRLSKGGAKNRATVSGDFVGDFRELDSNS